LRFSANLGFLWTDRTLPDAIRAAKAAGFDAVELHWPYEVPADAVAGALSGTGLPCLGLNTRRGDVAAGENGLSALPGREAEARAAIDEALDYAARIGAANVHVMSGVAEGQAAHDTFLANLSYACEQVGRSGIGLLIEPLNPYDAPGYFLGSTGQAVGIIDTLGHPALRLMFDCYHVQLIEGDLTHRLTDLMPRIGHIQIASVPDRGAPDHGELDYGYVFSLLETLGYDRPLGAEYKPGGDTDATLAWLRTR
jgi:hydroxypyruvate isomerase